MYNLESVAGFPATDFFILISSFCHTQISQMSQIRGKRPRGVIYLDNMHFTTFRELENCILLHFASPKSAFYYSLFIIFHINSIHLYSKTDTYTI